MSVMLGSSRRDGRPQVRLQDGEIVLVESSTGALRSWMLRLLTRLEVIFSPSDSRP
jgi:hypothetical protein